MSKTIEFTHKNKDYTLEFTRKAIEIMERQGFVASDIEKKPMTILPTLFGGAFIANHPTAKREVVDDIFSRIKNKQDLIGKLSEMYNEPILALRDEPVEDEGNIEWGASW
jgi:hypothetical protein